MRIFITGASGYIGQAVAKAFRSKGHTVYGLVRSEKDAHLLSLNEIWPILGDMEQPNTYKQVLNEVEVAVHCAFDFSSDKGVEHDATTIDMILQTFAPSPFNRVFIYTSGVWVYGSKGHQIADEAMSLNPLELVKWRPIHEEKVLTANSNKLRTIVIRAGHVYGGVGGLTNILFNSTQNGSVIIAGEGHNRWPMVHLQDLAHAYVSAAENELADGILNVVDDSTTTLREIAEEISRAANLEGKVHVLSIEEAKKQIGLLMEGFAIDLIVNNSRVKRLLEWKIHHSPFIYEVDLYYKAWQITQQIEEF